jgi:hypothetical protein
MGRLPAPNRMHHHKQIKRTDRMSLARPNAQTPLTYPQRAQANVWTETGPCGATCCGSMPPGREIRRGWDKAGLRTALTKTGVKTPMSAAPGRNQTTVRPLADGSCGRMFDIITSVVRNEATVRSHCSHGETCNGEAWRRRPMPTQPEGKATIHTAAEAGHGCDEQMGGLRRADGKAAGVASAHVAGSAAGAADVLLAGEGLEACRIRWTVQVEMGRGGTSGLGLRKAEL